MVCFSVHFSDHIISQMFKRNITVDDVKQILSEGEIIRQYPDDRPYPSFLLLGFIDLRPIHLVVAKKDGTNDCILVTVYEPDRNIWSNDYKSKIR